MNHLVWRREHATWVEEEGKGIEPEKRTGKVRFKNCYDGCPYQATFETNTALRKATGQGPSETDIRIRDRACRECKLPDRPTWEVAVVDRAAFARLGETTPYWLSVGVGWLKNLSR